MSAFLFLFPFSFLQHKTVQCLSRQSARSTSWPQLTTGAAAPIFPELLTVWKQALIDSVLFHNSTYTPSVHLMVEQRTSAEPRCAFGLCWLTVFWGAFFFLVRLHSSSSSSDKWRFQMIHANKAAVEQITRESPCCTKHTQYGCVCVCHTVVTKGVQEDDPAE